jgi:hypothetical protein
LEDRAYHGSADTNEDPGKHTGVAPGSTVDGGRHTFAALAPAIVRLNLLALAGVVELSKNAGAINARADAPATRWRIEFRDSVDTNEWRISGPHL